MKAMKEIIDTWNMIEKYEINGYKMEKGKVHIPETEYNRLMDAVKNKQYIKNLLA